jgi:Flp pilus assembly protein CpaB
MRSRSAGGLDLVTAALVAGGAALIAASIVVAAVLLTPVTSTPPPAVAPAPQAPEAPGRTSVALPADRVAAVLNVDAAAGAGAATRSGDHVDVLAYFSRQVTGAENVTRLLLRDVPVVSVARSAENVALTLAVPQADALLLQEAQTLGARPFVMLLPGAAQPAAADEPASFSDVDLAARLTGTH